MLKNRIYYQIKPYLPWRFRMGLRRIFARQTLRANKDVWPINPAAAQPPKDWPGWPDGKKFALVLTHDLEGPRGIGNIHQLVALEMKLGFRSSFNFIPEGEFSVPREVRAELVRKGFEVGVHDLQHDGKLFQDRADFARKAKRINSYLSEWGSSGFRSAFMHHNLDWVHDLEILYDSSTFDTDPFEPQPDGVNTIFPFWVPGATGRGYVELPYTLPQDSTLFLLLRENSIDIWVRKLDWIAEHGGMALVNVHPDYLRFDGEKPSTRTFSVGLYKQFLEYVRHGHSENYWNALPKEVSVWCRDWIREDSASKGVSSGRLLKARPRPLEGRSAAIVVYSDYPSDVRPRREAEALLAEGMSVDYICLEDSHASAGDEVHERLRVTRLPVRHERMGKAGYFRRYASFILRSMFLLAARSLSRRYDIVHVHNMPDLLVLSALGPRLRGAKVILDLHDPMPELYQTIFHVPADSVLVKSLEVIEKWSIGYADLALTPNKAFREVFCSRGCPGSKMHIVMNTPDEAIFSRNEDGKDPHPLDERRTEFRLMYHGLIAERQGMLTALKAMKLLADRAPGVVLDIYGRRTGYLSFIERQIREMGLENTVRYNGERRNEEIPGEISQTDLGLVPSPCTPFTEINFPTRIFEYLAMGRLVVAPRTRGVQDYFGDDEILYFEPGNPEDLTRAILQAREYPERTGAILRRGIEVYRQHLWTDERRRFVDLVEGLLEKT